MRPWNRARAVLAGGVAGMLVQSYAVASAAAAPLQVGPGQTYATPCEAIAAAVADDVIEIAAGTYTDSCAISVTGLTLRGVDGQPKIDLSGTDHPAQYKGIYVVAADDVTIENLELTGAHISADNGENAAAIRIEAAGLSVRGCNIHDNQNGILGGTTGIVTIENSEFFHNGQGDGCNGGGCTHNLYIANVDELHFRFNWTHAIATDTPDKGHLLKSRAKANYIEYNRITGEDGFDSYEIELPNGGYARIVGNAIEKGASAGNAIVFNWGAEGASNPDKNVFVIANTIVSDFGSGTFINAPGATLTVNDNLFVGDATPSSSGALSADNLSDVDPLFVDRAHYDYHLLPGSPAIGRGVAPVMAGADSLVPMFEYMHPSGAIERSSARDVGAFEHDTAVESDGGVPGSDAGLGTGGPGTGGSGSGGRPAGNAGKGGNAGAANTGSGGNGASAGKGGSLDAGSAVDAVDGGEAASADDDASGCGCSVPGARGRHDKVWVCACAALVVAHARARRRKARGDKS